MQSFLSQKIARSHNKFLKPDVNVVLYRQNGEDRIRTYDPLARITVFETAAFDHSATSPRRTG